MKLHVVEGGKLVPYERLGECKRCGECCRKKMIFQYYVSKPWKGEVCPEEDCPQWEGFSVIYAWGIHWYFLVDYVGDYPVNEAYPFCLRLEGNLCSIHDNRYKIPVLCPFWPVHPKDLLPGCGYRFERRDE